MPLFRQTLSKTDQFLSSTTSAIGKCASWLTVVMALVTSLIVVCRSFFGIGSFSSQDSLTYMHAIVIMLTSAYTLRSGGHVRVDIFYRSYNPLQKAWIDALGSALLLLPFALFTVAISWDYVLQSWSVLEVSSDSGGIPAIFLLKSLILLGGALLALQAIAELARNLLTITFENTEL